MKANLIVNGKLIKTDNLPIVVRDAYRWESILLNADVKVKPVA